MKMKKTVVLGDTHGRSFWKLIVNTEKPDRVIFIGDYFDSFNLSAAEQIHNFHEIVDYKESGKAEVIMLIGNHDYHYFQGIGYRSTSGYQYSAAAAITKAIEDYKHHLQMAYQMDEYLFTHAGVSPVWMDEAFGDEFGWKIENVAIDVNEMFKYRPLSFDFNGMEPTGDNTTQTPIWIRPRSLMSANKKHEKGLKDHYIQVVGHTQMKQLDIAGTQKWTGGRYYFIDTLDSSGEYLIIEDGVLRTGSWR
jgi:hypothetical protein